MSIVIMDLECTTLGKKERNREIEIIQIGCVKVNYSGDIIDTYIRNVRPIKNPVLSDYCKQLTNISQKDVDTARKFKNVINELYAWIGDSKFILTWGSDGDIWDKNCKFNGVPNKIKNRFIDYQDIIKYKYNTNVVCGLGKIVTQLGIDVPYNHNALNDSLVFYEWLKLRGFNESMFNKDLMKYNYTIDIYKETLGVEEFHSMRYVINDEFGITIRDTVTRLPSFDNEESFSKHFSRFKEDYLEGKLSYENEYTKKYIDNVFSNYVIV